MEKSDAGMGVDSERKIILVVDDDPAALEFKSVVLEERRYDVFRAPDGASALALLRDNDQIDLLYTDINMPEPDALEVARRARHQIPDPKQLFSSLNPHHQNFNLSYR